MSAATAFRHRAPRPRRFVWKIARRRSLTTGTAPVMPVVAPGARGEGNGMAVVTENRCLLDVVEIGKLARQIGVAFFIDEALFGTLLVAGIQAVHDVHDR